MFFFRPFDKVAVIQPQTAHKSWHWIDGACGKWPTCSMYIISLHWWKAPHCSSSSQWRQIEGHYLFSHRRASVAEFLTCATPVFTSWSTIFWRVSNSSLLVINFWFIFWKEYNRQSFRPFKTQQGPMNTTNGYLWDPVGIYQDSSLLRDTTDDKDDIPRMSHTPHAMAALLRWTCHPRAHPTHIQLIQPK